jgi:hypothetical protein
MKFNKLTILAVFISFSFLIAACGGKKDEVKKDDKKQTDKKTETSQTKKEVKKSDAPKKEEKPSIPEDWYDLNSPDGKLHFMLPGKWSADSKSEKGGENSFTSESPDKSMGLVAMEFPDAKVTADDLLVAQITTLDFEPEGSAFPVETENSEGWVCVVKGDLAGTSCIMYMFSLIDKNSPGNYLVYVWSPTDKYAANEATIEKIIYSVDVK